MSLALKSVQREPVVRSRLAKNPRAHIVVLNAELSTAKCRGGREQFPRIVHDRKESKLIKTLETSWTICDLEDVVQDRLERNRFQELEQCKLRHKLGIYGQRGDDLHFRKDIARAAGDELLKALCRTALSRYGNGLKDDGVLIILAAGWNANGASYHNLDGHGQAWRKAELVALAELCAMNGHPVSSFFAKMEELVHRSMGRHHGFLDCDVRSIREVKPPEQKHDVFEGCIVGGHLEQWFKGRKRNAEDDNYPATQKRRAISAPSGVSEDVRLFANATGLPLDTAAGIIESVGSVSAGLKLDMFQTGNKSQVAQTRFSGTLASSSRVIDLCDSDADEGDVETATPSPARDSVSELSSMGFSVLEAREALLKCSGDLHQALDILLASGQSM
eukprot:TRINITY_DN21727_c1_g3_i1.p1 TRINITY_DN21727_c1_g3~~TRINITY_DN21727_c1_g3_i1.p1  ORF type:complete len:453 (+),score=57.90 TRINITY_DN21727_c1_g3_i1:191-1360(+)